MAFSKCPNCQQKSFDGELGYCVSCGEGDEDYGEECKKCNSLVFPEEWNFCPECGVRL